MRGARTVWMVALIVAVAGSSCITLGAAPDQADVTIQPISGAPHCSLDDGELLMSNASGEWHYKGTYSAKAKNDGYGNEQCGNDPPNCFGQDCECTMTGSFELDTNDDRIFQTSCVFPNCLSCPTKHCDNATSNCPDTPTHCTCIYGRFQVTHYSDDGDNWIVLPSSPTVITESDLERPEECPTPANCDY